MVISTLSAMIYYKNNIICLSDKVLLGLGSFVGRILSKKLEGRENLEGKKNLDVVWLSVTTHKKNVEIKKVQSESLE